MYGVREAVILNSLIFWIAKNKANKLNVHDGRTWTFNSVKAMAELFPYLSAKQVRTSIIKLVDAGAIMKGKYNKNVYDNTSWYALSDEEMINLPLPKGKTDTCPGEKPTLAHLGKPTLAQMGKPIPVILPYTNTSTNTDTHEEEFNQFWALYPKRKGSNPRSQAYKSFSKAVGCKGFAFELILDGVVAYAKELADSDKLGSMYVAMASTWLNQERWDAYEQVDNTQDTSFTPSDDDLYSQ
jgi:hypothetical protein